MSRLFGQKALSSSVPNGLTLVARQPWHTAYGQCQALRYLHGRFEVAVVNAAAESFLWLPADRVLTEAQAQSWARTGRFRQVV